MSATPVSKLSKVASAFDFACSLTKDSDGNPVVIKMRRMRRIGLLPIVNSNPHIRMMMEAATEEERVKLKDHFASLTVEQKVEQGEQYLDTADKLLVAAAIEPLFCIGDGTDTEASVECIDENDRIDLMNEYLDFVGWTTSGKEASDAGRFRDDEAGGGAAGEPAAAAGESPAPTE